LDFHTRPEAKKCHSKQATGDNRTTGGPNASRTTGYCFPYKTII